MADQELFPQDLPVDEVMSDLFTNKTRQNPMSEDAATALAAHTFVLGGKQDIAELGSIKESLLVTGRSPAVSEAASQVQEERVSVELDLAEREISILEDAAQIEEMLRTAKERVDAARKAPVNFKAEVGATVIAQDAMAQFDPNDQAKSRMVLDDFLNQSEQLTTERSKVLQQLQGLAAQSEEGKVGTVGEFLQQAVPFFQQTSYAGAVARSLSDKGFIDKSFANQYAFSGEMKRAIAESFKNTPKEQLGEWYDAFTDAFKNEAGEIDVDDINALALLEINEEILERFEKDPGYDVSRVVDNSFAVIDAVSIGQLVKGAVKGVSSFLKNASLAETTKASDRTGTAIIAASVTDPQLAKTAGTDPVEAAIVAAYPKDALSAFANIDPDIAKFIPDATEIVDEATKLSAVLTDIDRANAIKRAKSEIDDFSAAMGYQANKSAIIDEDMYGFTMLARYGARNGKGGFRSYERALAAKEEYGLKGAKIVRATPEGKFEEALGPVYPEGQYYIEYKQRRNFDATDAGVFDETDAINSIVPDAYKEVTNILSKNKSEAVAFGYNRASYIQSIIGKTSEAFRQLNPKDRFNVLKAVQDSKNEARYMDREELVNGYGFNEKMVDGYKSLQAEDHLMWQINNVNFRNELNKQGFLYVENTDKGFTTFARPFRDAEQAKSVRNQSAFDPEVGHFVKLTDEEIDSIYASGGKIGTTSSRLKTGDDLTSDYYNLVVVRNTTKIKELPGKVLNEVPGYFGMRSYNEAFFIDKIPKEVTFNGARISKAEELTAYRNTIEAARTRAFGEQRVADLQAADPNHTYVLRQSRESLDKSMLDFEGKVEYYKDNGLLRGTKRGPALRLTDGNFAAQIDPYSAMNASRSKLAEYVTHEQIVSSLKQRWVNTYKELTVQGRFPVDKDQIASGTIDPAVLSSARTQFSYIKSLEQSGNTLGQKAYRSFWQSAANQFGKVQRNRSQDAGWLSAAEALAIRESVKGRDPLGSMRAMGFYLMVAGNPFRQALIQTSQHLMYVGLEPKFVASGALYRQSSALIAAAIKKGVLIKKPYVSDMYKDVDSATLAKLGGFKDSKELDKLYEAIYKSGIVQAVDHHAIAAGSARVATDSMSMAGYAVKSAVDLVPKLIREVGFDPWEGANRINTFLIARKRWMDKNPGKDWASDRAIAEIGGEAEALALNMNRAGQSQLLGSGSPLQLAFQYIAPAQKSINMMLPTLLGGSNTLKASEKARVAAVQALMWGSAGVGLKEIYDASVAPALAESQVPVPPVVDDWLEAGFATTAVNKLLQAVDGGGGLDLTTLSPTRELGLASALYSFSLGDDAEKTAIEFFFGPSATIWKRFADRGALARDILMYTPEEWDSTKVSAAMLQIGSINSFFNNYIISSMAADSGYWKNAAGDPIIEATWDQILAKKYFGINTKAQADEFRLRKRGGDWQKDIQDQVRRFIKLSEYLEQRTQDGDFNSVAESYKIMNLAIHSLDEEEKIEFFKVWNQEVKSRVRAGSNAPGYRLLQNYLRSSDKAVRQMILNSDLPDDVKNAVREIETNLEGL